MAEAKTEYLLFTCRNEACGKQFKMRRPSNGGIFKVTCPACNVQMHVNIPAPDGQPAPAPKPAAAAKPDNSGNERITIPGKYYANKQYQLECPHCGKGNISFNTDKTGTLNVSCPVCKGPWAITVKQPPVETVIVGKPGSGMTEIVSVVSSGPTARLVQRHRFGKKEEWPLTKTHMIIGRADALSHSDIEINDPYISRQSVELVIGSGPSGNTYRLSLLKSTNPVLVNNKPLSRDLPVYLDFGDTIQLGKTLLVLERLKR